MAGIWLDSGIFRMETMERIPTLGRRILGPIIQNKEEIPILEDLRFRDSVKTEDLKIFSPTRLEGSKI